MRAFTTATALALLTGQVLALDIPVVAIDRACQDWVGDGTKRFHDKWLRFDKPGTKGGREEQFTNCLEKTQGAQDRLKGIWGKISDRAQRECMSGITSDPVYVHSFLAHCAEQIITQRRVAEERFNAKAEACEEKQRRLQPCDP